MMSTKREESKEREKAKLEYVLAYLMLSVFREDSSIYNNAWDEVDSLAKRYAFTMSELRILHATARNRYTAT